MRTSSSVLSTRTGTRRGPSAASTPSRRASPATTGALPSRLRQALSFPLPLSLPPPFSLSPPFCFSPSLFSISLLWFHTLKNWNPAITGAGVLQRNILYRFPWPPFKTNNCCCEGISALSGTVIFIYIFLFRAGGEGAWNNPGCASVSLWFFSIPCSFFHIISYSFLLNLYFSFY